MRLTLILLCIILSCGCGSSSPKPKVGDEILGEWHIKVYFNEAQTIKESWILNIEKNGASKLAITSPEFFLSKKFEYDPETRQVYFEIEYPSYGATKIQKFLGTMNMDSVLVIGKHDYDRETMTLDWEMTKVLSAG